MAIEEKDGGRLELTEDAAGRLLRTGSEQSGAAPLPAAVAVVYSPQESGERPFPPRSRCRRKNCRSSWQIRISRQQCAKIPGEARDAAAMKWFGSAARYWGHVRQASSQSARLQLRRTIVLPAVDSLAGRQPLAAQSRQRASAN